jgi:hypothetical protein
MPVEKWKDEYYTTVYELVRGGCTMAQVADALKVCPLTIKNWYKARPALKEAVQRATAARRAAEAKPADQPTFREYCYQRLPADLQELMRQLEQAEREPNPERAIELLLADHGERTRQLLFVHVLATSARWNVAEALRKVGEPRSTFIRWSERDPNFQDLLLAIRDMKKDYLEGAYFGLVAAGDSAAILFGMRTLNADRGYSQKVTVQHQHEGSVLHAHVDVAKLDVDVDTKRKMLQAIREQRAADERALPAASGPIVPKIAPELLIDQDED